MLKAYSNQRWQQKWQRGLIQAPSILLVVLLGASATVGCRPANKAAQAEPSSVTPAVPAVADARAYRKLSTAELEAKLTKIQRFVTQESGTEPPFRNAYWDNHDVGLYVDVASGEPLFSSADKFDSGTGWPSFVRPIVASNVVSKVDGSLFETRVEVRSAIGDSHLGHVFDDGPKPTGKRYCINSAALRFIPLDKLEAEGYAAYRPVVGGAQVSLPPATSNSCAKPKEGERPGCAPTVETVVLVGDAGQLAAAQKLSGVLDGEVGTVGESTAVRVVFDPLKTSYSAVLDAWLASGAPTLRVLAPTAEQMRIGEAVAARTGKSVSVLAGAPTTFVARKTVAPLGSHSM
jgi:peptide methionine sulfoxide reductase msrA/msrB